MEVINIDIPNNEYDVVIGRKLKTNIVKFLSADTKNRNVLFVTDEYFSKTYVPMMADLLIEAGFKVKVFVMKGGKISKSFNEVLKIYGVLEINDYSRDSVLIAVGGGVIGDLAGFVASTWYRGMKLLHIPTTLMAMVDSSIGGKVAINFRDTINAVGNYYHPISNFMDIEMIDTLSKRDYISGLAEVIKCALIADDELLVYLENNRELLINKDMNTLVFCIRRAIEIKVDHVKNDVREGGKRLFLNYGHTIGHAIEMATNTEDGETFRHGEGVSLGISSVLVISQLHLGLPEQVVNNIKTLLSSYELPISFSASECGYKREELINKCMSLMCKDKKRKDNKLRFVLIEKIGKASVYSDISEQKIKLALESVVRE